MATGADGHSFANFMAVIEQQSFFNRKQSYNFASGVTTWLKLWHVRLAGSRDGQDAIDALAAYYRMLEKTTTHRTSWQHRGEETAAAEVRADGRVNSALRAYHRQSRKYSSYLTSFIVSVGKLRDCLAVHVANAFFNNWAQLMLSQAREQRQTVDKQATIIIDILQENFKKSTLDTKLFPDGEWTCVQVFTGGMNTTGLFVRHNSTNTIIDRVVRKVEYKSSSSWNDDTFWKDSVDSDGEDEQMPSEAFFTQKCGDASSSHFVLLRGWSTDESDYEINIYTQYCGLGDLYGLCRRYRENSQTMPESWLRYLFLHLSQACLYMLENALEPRDVEDWEEEIVHRDIKPSNIFLGPKGSGSFTFPAYPLPRLADFGLAFGTGDGDPENPTAFATQRSGTTWFRPPEQVDSAALTDAPKKYSEWEVGNDEQILKWSNIYGIGMTMYYLIRTGPWDSRRHPFIVTNSGARRLRSYQTSYSTTLIRLIEACIQKTPTDRIEPEDLKERLKDLIATDNYDVDAINGEQPVNTGRDLQFLPTPENYRVGFANADLAAILAQQA
ncbi:G2-specific protein kinase fin1 [Cercospora zeina]